ncbi:Ribosomal protein S36 mitochondrial [Penicillium expansum]|nr:Ribosomal protein S36 mitochondrial [Penicillium expansum]
MRVTSILSGTARTPLIRFVGKRSVPKSIDHSPRAQQHGPLGRSSFNSTIGGTSGAALGPIKPQGGEFFDRAELPARFGRLPWTQAEIDAIETGGASMFA